MDQRETHLRNPFAAAISVFGAALLAAQLAQAGPQQKTLNRGTAGPIGLAIDSEGRIHVSWESRDHHLHYTRIERGKKLDQVVDATSSCGAWSSIALDSTGLPHIAYYAERANPAGEALVYAHFDGSAWLLEELTQGGGFATAIAIDALDHPHIVHALRLGTFQYLHREDTDWEHEEPAGFTAWASSPMSLALDAAGHAHVGMQSMARTPVYATNASGDWVSTPLGDDFAGVTALALDSLGHPHVALPLTALGTVRYLHFDGAQWLSEDLYQPSELAPLANEPWAAALVLDAHDRPQILFEDTIYDPQDTERQIEVIVQAYHDGVEWRSVPLSTRGREWTRLSIDPNGVTQAAYAVYLGSENLQLAKSASVALPDVTGEWTSLAVTDQGAKSRVDAVLEVRNLGAGKSKGTPIALYLSNDAVLDPGDVPLSLHKAAGAVAPGDTRRVKISFARTGSLTGLYLIAVLDPKGRLDDLDRPNNTIAGLLGSP
jgi:hypothetical protein